MYRKTYGQFVLTVLMAMPLAAQSIGAPETPENLRVPEGNVAYLKGQAEGTQNYMCLPAGNGLAWKFIEPNATFFVSFRWMNGDVRQQIGTHFLSPNPAEGGTARATWQSSLDTSAVWAKKIEESSDPAFVAAGAIPWFLLEVVGTRRGPNGGTALTRTTFIQRVNTGGGTAPTSACTEIGKIEFVPYTADYLFYRARNTN